MWRITQDVILTLTLLPLNPRPNPTLSSPWSSCPSQCALPLSLTLGVWKHG